MKVDCTIDGKVLTLDLNSDKPLSLILMEDIGSECAHVHCNGNMCGHCIVLLNGKAVLSCLVPAFAIRGKTVTTFDSYQRTKNYKDIERSYEMIGYKPCSSCYASRTLLIESLISHNLTETDDVIREMAILKCDCMEMNDLVKIVQAAAERRRKRHARKPEIPERPHA